jgi:hypothetical protein
MATLTTILENEMLAYAGRGANGYSFAKFIFQEKNYVETSLLARIVGEKIIIEDDKTNKPLVDALVQAGIPREQIVLAYAGEKVEETA